MYFTRQFDTGFVWISGDSISKLFFEAVRVLEGKFLSALNEMAVVELGFDTAHGWCEAMLAIVAIAVSALRCPAFGQNLVACT
jgi:hypothetical protein